MRSKTNPALAGRDKVFVVSDNHSGTTSFRDFFLSLGMSVGDQQVAEDLWRKASRGVTSGVSPRHWHRYIKSASVFQDVTFSLPHFLPWLLWHYPQAAYIHVSRNETDWYESLVKHHLSSPLGIDVRRDASGSVIWSAGLQALADSKKYRGQSLYTGIRARYGTPPHDPYRRDSLIAQHKFQNDQARALLWGKRSLLLELEDLSKKSTLTSLENLLERQVGGAKIPRSNKHP